MMSNATIADVSSLGCFKSFDTVSCIRDSIEALAAIVTAAVCIYKIIRLYIDKLELWDQYIVFSVATVECVICAINWLYIKSPICDFIAALLKLLQLLVVFSYYCQMACRVSKREPLYKKQLLPGLGSVFLYFLVLVTVGIINIKEDAVECLESEWLQLSISEVALCLLFVLTGIYITRKVNAVVTEMTYKKQLRFDLWGIILIFQLSAFCSLSYDIVMFVVGSKNNCKGVFISQLAQFTTIHVAVRIFKWFLPIWAMILIFRRRAFTSDAVVDEESEPPLLRNSSHGQPFFSQFRPRGTSFHYKHLVDPGNERRLVFPKGSSSPLAKKSRRKKRSSKSSTGSHSDLSSSGGTGIASGSINSAPADEPIAPLAGNAKNV